MKNLLKTMCAFMLLNFSSFASEAKVDDRTIVKIADLRTKIEMEIEVLKGFIDAAFIISRHCAKHENRRDIEGRRVVTSWRNDDDESEHFGWIAAWKAGGPFARHASTYVDYRDRPDNAINGAPFRRGRYPLNTARNKIVNLMNPWADDEVFPSRIWELVWDTAWGNPNSTPEERAILAANSSWRILLEGHDQFRTHFINAIHPTLGNKSTADIFRALSSLVGVTILPDVGPHGPYTLMLPPIRRWYENSLNHTIGMTRQLWLAENKALNPQFLPSSTIVLCYADHRLVKPSKIRDSALSNSFFKNAVCERNVLKIISKYADEFPFVVKPVISREEMIEETLRGLH